MTYTVSFSDSTNPAKPPITVADGALNNQTSLSFVGQNYSGYGPVIASNFLHLLENFANSSAPINPVQGQLWYDTSIGANILRVYNGTQWVEAGSLKKATASNQPSISASVAGDLWVDTTNSQLYLFSGASWLLVGPTFSAGLQTGPIVESIVDTTNVSRSVISMYVSSADDNTSYRVAIISKDSFIPKVSITGYTAINQGINLYSNGFTTDQATIWGTSQSANALVVGTATVQAANFLRGDVTSTSNSALNIRNAGGLSIGTDLSFNIAQGNTAFTVFSKSTTKSIEFSVNNNILVHLDPSGNVGIGPGNTSPSTALSVAGVITSGIAGAPGGLIVTDGSNPSPNTVLTVDPTTGITTTLNATSSGNLTVGGVVTVGSGVSGGSVILPATSTSGPLFDIGSLTQPFRNIYANTFTGSFNGTFTGTVLGNATGTATALQDATTFSMTGDIITTANVNFTGNSGPATLDTVANTKLISTKTQATSAAATDQMLILQTSGSSSNLVRMSRQTFLSGVGIYSIPVGIIMPFAGPVAAVPAGWLLCDGSEVSTAVYNQLFLAIGYIYKAQTSLQGVNTFALPDMRGRMPLGLTNMNNYGNIAGFTQAIDAGGHTVNTGGQTGTATDSITVKANQTLAATLGAVGGSDGVVLNVNQIPDHHHSLNDGTAQYYAPGLNGGVVDTGNNTAAGYSISSSGTGYALKETAGMTTGGVGDNVNLLNPFMAVNYIIFTGAGLS
jgi:microcystin-dependent protein